MTMWSFHRLATLAVFAAAMGGASRPVYAQTRIASDGRGESADTKAGDELLARRVSAQLDHVALKAAIDTLASTARVQAQYREDVIARVTRSVTLHATDMRLGDALEQILRGTGLRVVPVDGTLFSVVVTPSDRRGSVADSVVVGRVVDGATRKPIVNAAVTIESLHKAVRTGADGTFRMRGVPAGSYRVTVRSLGYRVQSLPLVVSSEGHPEPMLVALSVSTNVLNEVVTTATGDQRRLEIGNAIGTIKADSVVPTTLIRNMSDLLQARVPGVVVSNTSGLVGAPSKIRIRGVSSIQLNNDPIIIVDGVRLLGQTTLNVDQMNIGRASTAATPGRNKVYPSQDSPSRLDDIDPNTIESIDVLRGPSASSLYGTEAANGVIVIKTKRGQPGPFRLSLLADDGWSTPPGDFPLQYFTWAHSVTGGLYNPNGAVGYIDVGCVIGGTSYAPNFSDGSCVLDSVTAFNAANNPNMSSLGTGTAQNLSATLSGGTAQLGQSFSGRISNNVGMARLSPSEQRRVQRMWGETAPSWMLHPNTEQDASGSTRTDLHPSSALDLSLSGNFIYRNVLNGNAPLAGTPNANNGGITSGADTLSFLSAEAMAPRQTTTAKRGFGSAAGHYAPFSWLSLRATGGGDYTLRVDDDLLRSTECTTVLVLPDPCYSSHLNERGETFVTTFDIGAQASFAPFAWMTSRTAVGEQADKTTFSSIGASNGSQALLAFGSVLLSPAPVALSGTPQLYSVTESRDASATAGWYVEQTIAVRERLFLTAAFRKDAASAFGRNVNRSLPTYPKYSLSWLVSDESFFPWKSVIPSFRIRSAYGHSGTQARQNDVLANYAVGNVLDANGAPAAGLSLSQIPNPNLKPERSTEWEGGFDASLFSMSRLNIVATLYRKLSQDAIVRVTLPGSVGTSSIGATSLSQAQNMGAVENRGAELSLDMKLVDARAFGWDLSVNASRNTNKLVHLNAGSISLGTCTLGVQSCLKAGYPLNGYWGVRVLSYADRNGDGMLDPRTEVAYTDTMSYFGASYPKSELTYTNSFSFWHDALRVTAMFDQLNGLSNRLTPQTAQTGALRMLVDPSVPLTEQAAGIQCLLNRACIEQTTSVRFGELSVTYAVPPAMVRRYLRAQSASMTFAGRNLGLWTTYAGKDPNVDHGTTVTNNGFTEVTTDGGSALPEPRNFTFRVNLGF